MAYTEQATSKYVQAGDVKMHYNEAGSGKPLILIHGGGPGVSGWSNYSRNVDELAKNNRVIAIDLPGFGKSEKKHAEAGLYGFHAKTINAMFDALDIQQANFIGNSLGGGTTLKFALDYPDRVGKLVLMGPGGSVPPFTPWPSEGIKLLSNFYSGEGPSMAKLKGFLDIMLYDKSGMTEQLLEERYKAATLPEVLANPPPRMKGGGGPPPEELWKENLAGLKHDVLLIWGREDRVVPLDMSLLLLNRIPKAQLHVFPKCGHWCHWEKAGEFNALVTQFFKG